MGGIAFLIMLGSFAFLTWWYIRNVEQEADGSVGLLALVEPGPEPGSPDDAPQNAPELPETDAAPTWQAKDAEPTYRRRDEEGE